MPQHYTCPGEKYPISRSVHLSRLAAFYPKCRDCQHRHDTGQLPQQTLERLQSTEHRVERRSLFTSEGVRGVYLNELTRHKAGEHAGALASLLWSEFPLIGCVGPLDSSPRRQKRTGPVVVVGHDERPSSPDIVIGVVSALRRVGCQVVDIGLTSKPCFCFAVDHLQAASGVYVTGAGCQPSWTGCDLVGDGSQPFACGGRLDELSSRYRDGFSRPTRYAGSYRCFQARLPYEAGLWKHFSVLRPLTISCGCPSRTVRRILDRLFRKLPCELVQIPLPARVRNMNDPNDPDVRCVSQSVRESAAQVGVLIDDDGMGCVFFDERGQLIAAENLLVLLANHLISEVADVKVVVSTDLFERLALRVTNERAICLDGGKTAENLWHTFREHNAQLGLDRSCRYWFRESYPASDALLTIAKVLQTLGRSDTPFSKSIPD